MLRAPVITWLAIGCLTLLPMASQAQVVEQYYGVKRVNTPADAPSKPQAAETTATKPEATAKKVDPSEPTPIATATPLQPIDYRPVQRENAPQWLPLLTPTDPYKALAAPNPAPAEEKLAREPAEPVQVARVNTTALANARIDEPRDIWEWAVVLGRDSQAWSVGLGSAATMLALVAIMRPRPMQAAPVVNVTMPTTSTTMQGPGPMMGWAYQEPRRKKRSKKKSSPAEAEYTPREPNFSMGPTFEEEQAETQLMAQKADDAMLMGLVNANVAMRGAMTQATEEPTPTAPAVVS